MKEQVIITIITVSYNAVKTIEQTISSVVNQSYPNIEYIIIDGGSTDGTVDIIKKYEDKIVYWVSEPDGGIYGAMNKGVSASTGDYVYFLGADDCLADYEIIDNVVDDIKVESADIYSYGVYMVSENAKQKYIGNKESLKNTSFPGMIPHQGMFAKRNIALKFKFDLAYKILADYKFYLQCLAAKDIKIVYKKEPVAFFSLSGISGTNLEIMETESEKLANELGVEYRENPSIGIRFYVKEILKFIGVLSFCKSIRDRFGWKRHKCNNKICRWCRRYNP